MSQLQMDYEAHMFDFLEQRLLDANKDPTGLPLSLLKAITNNFSNDQEIGRGGFAVVYEGLLKNGSVAVKRLSGIADSKFNEEVTNMMRLKHKNIVRILGYCADTQGRVVNDDNREMVMADVQQRLLCFEFLPNGGLDCHIRDSAGLEWRTCYQIIKGICEGLNYLHQHEIVHLDLKPENILLDCNLVPKISDFGLSMRSNKKQTGDITGEMSGTLGYMAPEIIDGLAPTFKSDIYSFGIIITEILTGKKQSFQIENVLERWTARFQTSQGGTLLEYVKVCANIALECRDPDPVKRPTTEHILERLGKLEQTNVLVEIKPSEMSVYPLQVRFPWEANKCVECPVTLTNRTDHHVGIWISPTFPDKCNSLGCSYLWENKGPTLFRRVMPHSSLVIPMTTKKQQQRPRAHTGMFNAVMFTTKTETGLENFQRNLNKYSKSEDTLNRAIKELATEVFHANLRAVTCDPAATCQEVTTHQFGIRSPETSWCNIESIDVHPTETWVLVGHKDGYASIWNYETLESVKAFQLIEGLSSLDSYIWSTKFIAGEHWFAAGDNGGSVHVYDYSTDQNNKVLDFEAHYDKRVDMLALHPTDTLLLTTSSFGKSIKLWDWSQDWTCVRVFEGYTHSPDNLVVGPIGTNRFASSGFAHGLKVWNFNYSEPIATLPNGGRTVFYIDNRRNLLARLFDYNGEAEIWEFGTKELARVHKLLLSRKPSGRSCMVARHPTLPIVACLLAGTIFLWDCKTYRLLKRLELQGDGFYMTVVGMVLVGNEDLTRLVIGTSEEGISVFKFKLPSI